MMGVPDGRDLRLGEGQFVYFACGAYSLIFVDRAAGLARKVFLNDKPRAHVEETFASELEAYAIAANSPDLVELVAGRLRLLDPQVLLDGTGKVVHDACYGDLAYEMAFVDAPFEKIGAFHGQERQRIEALFHRHGILNTRDASVAWQGDRIVKVIDFGMRDIELEAQPFGGDV